MRNSECEVRNPGPSPSAFAKASVDKGETISAPVAWSDRRTYADEPKIMRQYADA